MRNLHAPVHWTLFWAVSSSFPMTIFFTYQESIDRCFLAFHRGSLLAQLILMYRISFLSNVLDCTPAEHHSLWTPQASPLHTAPWSKSIWPQPLAQSSERNKIFSSLNVFISLDGKCPIIHCLTLLEVHCWSIQLSAAQFCSSFCAWCLAATEKPCKARSRVTTCWTLCVVG